MRPATIFIASACVLLPGCAPQPGSPAASASPSGRQCFLAQQVNGYTPVSDNVVLLQAGASRYFRLELAGVCPNIDWSRRIALRTKSGGSWICQGLDAEIIVPDPVMLPQRCLVTNVRQISKDEWRAARRAR
jgi:hypothetical protein